MRNIPPTDQNGRAHSSAAAAEDDEDSDDEIYEAPVCNEWHLLAIMLNAAL